MSMHVCKKYLLDPRNWKESVCVCECAQASGTACQGPALCMELPSSPGSIILKKLNTNKRKETQNRNALGSPISRPACTDFSGEHHLIWEYLCYSHTPSLPLISQLYTLPRILWVCCVTFYHRSRLVYSCREKKTCQRSPCLDLVN